MPLAGADSDPASVAACRADPNYISVQSGTLLGRQPYWIVAAPRPMGSGWAVSGPSADCASATTGTVTRDVNLLVGTQQVALYRWEESASRSHVCVRAGGPGGAGGRLTG